MNIVAIPDADRRRLAGVASRMASDHDGEALNATRLAVRTLARFGLRIGDVIDRGVAPVHLPPTPLPPRSFRSHTHRAARCLATAQLWNEREIDFLRSMASQRSAPTQRQEDWLIALEEKQARQAGQEW